MAAKRRLSPDDPSSFSRPSECRVNALDLVWDIDFIKSIINGTAYLDVEKSSASVDRLVSERKNYFLNEIRSFFQVLVYPELIN